MAPAEQRSVIFLIQRITITDNYKDEYTAYNLIYPSIQ